MNKIANWRFPIVLATLLLASACSEPEVVEKPELVRPAKLFEVKVSDNVKEYRLPAIVEAVSSTNLVFQESGQLLKLNVREGDAVVTGQVIAELDKRVFKNDLAVATTKLETAKIEFERAKRLMAADAIAKSIFDEREGAYEVALTNLDNAKKALEDTVLLAPFSGTIANTYVDELNAVSPTTAIATLQTNGPAEAKARIPASLVARMKQTEALETTVELDSEVSVALPAKRVGVIALADERSQTFEVSFSFEPLESMTVLPGMTGVLVSKVAFMDDLGNVGNIFVPMGAVLSDASGQYVWVVDKSSYRVSRQDIDVGEIDGGDIMISKGLNEGDTIIAAGGSYLQEGYKIRPLEN